MLAVTSCLVAKFGTQFWAGVETMCEHKMSEFRGKSVYDGSGALPLQIYGF